LAVKVIASRNVYRGAISLRIDRFSVNEKKVVEKEIVEHQPSVGIIAVMEDDSLVLVKQYRRAADKILLEIPAGKIEKGETPKQAAVREMDEEIGFSGKIKPFLKWYLAPGYDTELMYLFIATNLTKIDKRRKMDDDEDIVVRRLKLSAAIRKCLSGEIEDAKTIAAIMAYASCCSYSSLKPL
jgi:ADP-ribose pyrophosphatase